MVQKEVVKEFYILSDGQDALVSLEDDMPVMYESKEAAEYASTESFKPQKVEVSYGVERGDYVTRQEFKELAARAHALEKQIKKLKKAQETLKPKKNPIVGHGGLHEWLRDD